MSTSKLGLIAVLTAMVISVAFAACASDPEPTATPTAAPVVKATVAPTATPQPEPTATPQPTATPEPTATPKPTATPEPTLTPTPTVVPYPTVKGIVDPSNRDWPREVELADEVIVVKEPPQRVLAYSLGHDEILIALIDPERFAAVGPFAGDPAYSNVADQAADLPTFESGVENVLAAKPDLVLASKYTDVDVINLIKEAGVPVARTALESSSEGNIPNILLIGYMLGVEERALELVSEIENRLKFIADQVPPPNASERPFVISISRYSDSIYAAGSDTTEGGILESGGGVNASARDGVEGHQVISIEAIAAMNPDVILIAQPVEYGANEFRDDLLNHPALASVSAVSESQIHVVDSRLYTTLSHWNVRGIEETARLLYPDKFSDVTFEDFKPYDRE